MSLEKKNVQEIMTHTVDTLPQVYRGQLDAIYEKENVNMKDFVIGALVGGIVGTAVGLLLAPKTGKELRDEVAVQAGQLKDRSAELSTSAKDRTLQLSKQLQEQSNQLLEKVKTLKTAKEPTVFDDGTVSSEGEEPLDNILDEVMGSAEELHESIIKNSVYAQS